MMFITRGTLSHLRARGYKTFSKLNPVEHESLNAHKF